MKFAAIDIGSNAVRLLVEDMEMRPTGLSAMKVSFIRVPLRLGDDVFEHGSITPLRQEALVKTMKAFWYLMDVHGVETFRACATSAMREAKNAADVVRAVAQQANIDIEIIDGEHEAELIFNGFRTVSNGTIAQDFLYIDVGGGSTELTLIRGGARLRSRSFRIGTVRALKGGIADGEWDAVAAFLDHVRTPGEDMLAIGTGGNINRLHRMTGASRFEPISTETVRELHAQLAALTFEQRVIQLGMKTDRADVIVPAAEIYTRILDAAGCTRILVPKVGLSDGIVLDLFTRWQVEQDGPVVRMEQEGK